MMSTQSQLLNLPQFQPPPMSLTCIVSLTLLHFTRSHTNTQTQTVTTTEFDGDVLQRYINYRSFDQLPSQLLDTSQYLQLNHVKSINRFQNETSSELNEANDSAVSDKPLMEFDVRDGIMMSIAALALFIAAGGGIGGGGVLVPLYILVGQFPTVSGVALSNVTVMGGALANLICNIRRRNSLIDKPLIDWDLIMIMEGPTILGAIVGGYINKLLPSWMTGLFLLLLLVQMSWVLMRKGVKMYSTETRTKVLQNFSFSKGTAAQSGNDLNTPLLQSQKISHKALDDSSVSQDSPAMKDETAEIQQEDIDPEKSIHLHKSSDDKMDLIIAREKRNLPWERVLLLFIMFISVGGCDLTKSYISYCGSLVFWCLSIAPVPVVIIITGIMRSVILDKCKLKEESNVQNKQEVAWNPTNTINFPAICSLAGLVAGMFGVGGGIVKAPLMLAMGVPPDVAAATSATMIFFTAGSASTIYISFGAVPIDYGSFLFGVGFVVTLAGQLLIYGLVNKSGRRSFIALSMALFMLCSAIMMGVHVVFKMMALVTMHADWFDINKICG